MVHCVCILEDMGRKRLETFSGTPAEVPVDIIAGLSVEGLDILTEVHAGGSVSLAEVVESLVPVAVECLLWVLSR